MALAYIKMKAWYDSSKCYGQLKLGQNDMEKPKFLQGVLNEIGSCRLYYICLLSEENEHTDILIPLLFNFVNNVNATETYPKHAFNRRKTLNWGIFWN